MVGMNIIKYFVILTDLKRFLIHCDACWCGMDNTFRVLAKEELDIDDYADNLAYDNFMTYADYDDIIEELGYDLDELSDTERDEILSDINECDYWWYDIEECEDDEEWNSYSDEIIVIESNKHE